MEGGEGVFGQLGAALDSPHLHCCVPATCAPHPTPPTHPAHAMVCAGDMQLTKRELAETQMIVTTPEKWDVITRKVRGSGKAAAVLCEGVN